MNNPPIHILVVAGIRPQYIKAAAFDHAVQLYSEKEKVFSTTFVDTGQHYDNQLSGAIISELGIKFDYTFRHSNTSPIHILGHSIIKLYELLESIQPKPDWIVVFGDGNPAFVGAIAAHRHNIPIIHIEAGAKRASYEDEEKNRFVVDKLADIHFCSTKLAVEVLKTEGSTKNLFWTGDLTYNFTVNFAKKFKDTFKTNLSDFILVTIHRSDNLDRRTLENISIVLEHYHRDTIFVCHPRTRKKLEEYKLLNVKNFLYFPPLSYSKILSAIKQCAFLLTDSGGLIREAYYLNKRSLIRRDLGGWPELVNANINARIGRSQDSIIEKLDWIERQLEKEYIPINDIANPDGYNIALSKIVEVTILRKKKNT